MKVVYSRLAKGLEPNSPTYWQYFGARLADLAAIPQGATALDVGTLQRCFQRQSVRANTVEGLGLTLTLSGSNSSTLKLNAAA
ncbi:MAG: hypothetical protein WCP58_02435 [bacterium]|jgi:hypothetical protein